MTKHVQVRLSSEEYDVLEELRRVRGERHLTDVLRQLIQEEASRIASGQIDDSSAFMAASAALDTIADDQVKAPLIEIMKQWKRQLE